MTNISFTQNIEDAIRHLRYIRDLENELDYIENDLNKLNMNLRMSNLIKLKEMGFLSNEEFNEIVDEYLQRSD